MHHTAECYHGLIATPKDAVILLEASIRKVIPTVTRRLSDYERMGAIVSGAVFIWNESESRMKRWTDGKSWSASRVNGCFLIYKEMEHIPPNYKSFSYKKHGLLKQSFTITLKDGNKYHLISYLNSHHYDIAALKRPSMDENFANFDFDRSLYPESLLDYSQLTTEISHSPPFSPPLATTAGKRSASQRGLSPILEPSKRMKSSGSYQPILSSSNRSMVPTYPDIPVVSTNSSSENFPRRMIPTISTTGYPAFVESLDHPESDRHKVTFQNYSSVSPPYIIRGNSDPILLPSITQQTKDQNVYVNSLHYSGLINEDGKVLSFLDKSFK